MTRGRYAPSPTGRLHLGNLRTALLAWLQARIDRGVFILRIDDLDTPRNKPGSVEQMIQDLYWIGLDWDEGPDVGGEHAPYFQSQRLGHYEKAFHYLQEKSAVFPCKCSRKDIANAISAPNGAENNRIYPGTCRPGKNHIHADNLNSPGVYAWRYCVNNQNIVFEDAVLGHQRQKLPSAVGDFVVKRKDGLFAYQLTSILDDILMSVTDVVRADDLLDSTPRQIAILKTLQGTIPRFCNI